MKKIKAFKRAIAATKKYFNSKIIVYSKGYPPGELRDRFRAKGIKYVRIAITNRQELSGYDPITDVKFSLVTKYEALPSPFKKDMWGLFGKKPNPKTFNVN